MKYLVTGAAGFIGSSLVDTLLQQGHEVIGVDNLSTGVMRYLESASKYERFHFYKLDLVQDSKDHLFSGVDAVFHLAANADIRDGLLHPFRDIEQGILVTFNVLESMRKSGVKNIVFSSSAAAIGEPTMFPTPENLPCPTQTSLYGTSKMACEGLISSYCFGYGFNGFVFRFVSLMGPRYPHGHVFDFVKQLIIDPTNLTVLGDGTQRKSYMHIDDCISAIVDIPNRQLAHTTTTGHYDVFNLGIPSYCFLSQSIQYICEELRLDPTVMYGGGNRGWIGDNPFVFLDVSKAMNTGWKPVHTIESSIKETARWLFDNKWIFDVRK